MTASMEQGTRRSLRQRAATVLTFVLPSVLFVFAIGKLGAWNEFVGSLDSYSLVSVWLREAAIYLLPMAEATPFILCLAGRPVAANALSVGLVLLLTGVVAWHWINNIEPTCACLGMWTKYMEVERTARFQLIRNGVLATAGVVAIFAKLLADRHSDTA